MRFIDWFIPLNFKFILVKIFRADKENEAVRNEELPVKNPFLFENKEFNSIVPPKKKCYIIACGPSINEMNLTKLKEEDCITVSNFFVHHAYSDIQPKYHVFAPSHQPITEDQYAAWLKDYEGKTEFEQTLFFPFFEKELIEKHHLLEKKRKIFYESSVKFPDEFEKILLDEKMPAIQTVVHLAMYLAISLGYEEIILLGVDHNWILHHGKSVHFYKENESELVNKGYNEYENVNWENQFQTHLNLWKVYKSIKQYSDKKGINIFNATPNSLLDVFERKDFTVF